MSTRAAVGSLLVAVAFAVGAVYVAVDNRTAGEDSENHEPRLPATPPELEAAHAARSFVGALRDRNPAAVCSLVAERSLRREFRCHRKPRIPSRYTIPADTSTRVWGLIPADTPGATGVGFVVKRWPAMRVEVDALGKVVGVVGFGVM